jgi:hypothetical protein
MAAVPMRPFAATIASAPETGERECVNQTRPDLDVAVLAACKLGATHLGPPLGLADGQGTG